jgi:hypothetical protein
MFYLLINGFISHFLYSFSHLQKILNLTVRKYLVVLAALLATALGLPYKDAATSFWYGE